MAFDMGWNFRGSSGYVTDPAYAVPGLAEAYPHTYTNGNGDSVNAGWTSGNVGGADRSTDPDVRLAGINYASGGSQIIFRVALGSGSSPGAGDYTVDLAMGEYSLSPITANPLLVKDDSTTLISITGDTGGANQYLDATGTNRSPGTSSWDLVRQTVSVTFATTTCYLDHTWAGAPRINHFRLTLEESTDHPMAAAVGALTLSGIAALLKAGRLLRVVPRPA